MIQEIKGIVANSYPFELEPIYPYREESFKFMEEFDELLEAQKLTIHYPKEKENRSIHLINSISKLKDMLLLYKDKFNDYL